MWRVRVFLRESVLHLLNWRASFEWVGLQVLDTSQCCSLVKGFVDSSIDIVVSIKMWFFITDARNDMLKHILLKVHRVSCHPGPPAVIWLCRLLGNYTISVWLNRWEAPGWSTVGIYPRSVLSWMGTFHPLTSHWLFEIGGCCNNLTNISLIMGHKSYIIQPLSKRICNVILVTQILIVMWTANTHLILIWVTSAINLVLNHLLLMFEIGLILVWGILLVEGRGWWSFWWHPNIVFHRKHFWVVLSLPLYWQHVLEWVIVLILLMIRAATWSVHHLLSRVYLLVLALLGHLLHILVALSLWWSRFFISISWHHIQILISGLMVIFMLLLTAHACGIRYGIT